MSSTSWISRKNGRKTLVENGDIASDLRSIRRCCLARNGSLPPPSGISFDLVDTSDIIKSPNKMAVLLEITIVSIGVSVEILNFAQELTCLQNYCLAPRSLARLCVADAYT